MMVDRPLFGGAIAVSIPEHWRDVSDVRQVPDHQECWQDFNQTEALLVVEVLERQDSVANDCAAEYFFQDLAESNGCSKEDSVFCANSNNTAWTQSSLVRNLPASAVVVSGMGRQIVAMGKETDMAGNPRHQVESTVCIFLAAIRLPEQSTDLLVTYSVPAAAIPTSTAAARENATIAVVATDGDGDNTAANHELLFGKILASLQIKDWTLFG